MESGERGDTNTPISPFHPALGCQQPGLCFLQRRPEDFALEKWGKNVFRLTSRDSQARMTWLVTEE